MVELNPKKTEIKNPVSLNKVTDTKVIDLVNSSKRGNGAKSSAIAELLEAINKRDVGEIFEVKHNAGAISRIIKKKNLKDNFKVIQRKLEGNTKPTVYIKKVK